MLFAHYALAVGSPTYFFLVVQTVVNIIRRPPIKIAIAKPAATEFSHSVFSITSSLVLNHRFLVLGYHPNA